MQCAVLIRLSVLHNVVVGTVPSSLDKVCLVLAIYLLVWPVVGTVFSVMHTAGSLNHYILNMHLVYVTKDTVLKLLALCWIGILFQS